VASLRPPSIKLIALLPTVLAAAQVRGQVLRFFNADPAAWQLVFTRSATGALKMVGETFPWSRGSLFRSVHCTRMRACVCVCKVLGEV
jgi:hypothetical protein